MVEDCQIFTVPGNNFKRKEETHLHLFIKKDFYYFKNFYLGHATCRILPPRLGMQHILLAMEVHCPNHWTTREFYIFKINFIYLRI